MGEDKGKERWRAVAYFSTVQNALKEMVNIGVKETQLKDLKTVVEKLDELYKLIGEVKK